MVIAPGKRKFTNYLLILVLALSFSCSKEKETVTAKFYHSTTSYFNGYYNSVQLFKETIDQLEEKLRYDDNGFIYVVYYGTEEEIKSYSSAFETIIEKNDKVIFKHPNGQYIDNCRFLNGKSWFYRRMYSNAMENFNYIQDEFPASRLIPETYFWQAQSFYLDQNPEMCFSVLEEYFDDNDTLKLSNDLAPELGQFRARLALEQGEYQDAITWLEKYGKKIPGERRKVRTNFLLGQLYSKIKEFPQALEQFEQVVRHSNDYDLTFAAKLKIARLYINFQKVETSDETVMKYLSKMLKDEKNEEYRDQIFYEYGLLELGKGQREAGLDYLRQSVAANVNNSPSKSFVLLQNGPGLLQ